MGRSRFLSWSAIVAFLSLFTLSVLDARGDTHARGPTALAQLDIGEPIVPIVAARGVLPLPSGHDVDLAAPQLALVTASGTVLPTQVERCMTLGDEVRSVELVALAPSFDLPLRVERRAAPPSTFVPDLRVVELLAHGLTFTAAGIDAPYSARVGFGELALEPGAVRTRARISVPLRPDGAGAQLASLGWLRGTATAYSGLPLVEFDLLWHTGEVTEPLTEAFFRSLTLDLAPGWVLIPASAQPWMGRGTAGGKTRVELVRDAREISGDEWHTFRGQHGKVLRFALLHASFEEFADLWRANSGLGQMRPVPGSADPSWWAGNHATPLALDGFALPALPKAALTRALADMQSFRTRRLAGEAFALAPHGRIGWLHPAGTRYGAMTGGDGIEHTAFVPELLTGSPLVWEHLWGDAEAWLDRQGGWLFEHGEPWNAHAWLLTHPNARINFAITPVAPGSGVSPAWPSATQDPWKWRTAPRNGPSGSGGAGEAAIEAFGWCDTQHLVRLFRAWVVLAAYANDPLAKDLIECYAASVRADLAAVNHPSASLYGLEQAAFAARDAGSVINRSEGWSAALQAHDVAFNGTESARWWLAVYANVLRLCQLPSGGFIAWDANKEATAYAKEESGGKDLAVTQNYQETIHAWALRLIARLDVTDVAQVRARQLRGLLHVYRAPGASEPPYRLAVYPKGQPKLAVKTWGDVQALYASKESSGYHHTVTLALALEMEIEGAMQAARDFAGGGDPLALLFAANKFWGNRAALASELQRRAG
jgi:hypothetical protein